MAAVALQLRPPSGGPPSGGPLRGLSAAARARREAPEAQAVRRAQAVYVDEWNDALLAEAEGGARGRARTLLMVVESLGHALRAWVLYGHSPAAVAGYYAAGVEGPEHARAADLVETLRGGYEAQAGSGPASEEQEP